MNEVTPRRAPAYVRTGPVPQRACVMSAPNHDRWALEKAALVKQSRGEITILRRAVWSNERQRWEIIYRRLKPAAPAWRKPTLIAAGALGGCVAVLGSAYWALHRLDTSSGAVALFALLAVFVTAVAMTGRKDRGTYVHVSTRVRIK